MKCKVFCDPYRTHVHTCTLALTHGIMQLRISLVELWPAVSKMLKMCIEIKNGLFNEIFNSPQLLYTYVRIRLIRSILELVRADLPKLS